MTGRPRRGGAPSRAPRGVLGEPATAPRPLRPEIALAIVARACVGLQKAHDAGVRVHGGEAKADVALTERGASPSISVVGRPALVPGRSRPPAASPPRISPPAPAAPKPDIDKKFD